MGNSFLASLPIIWLLIFATCSAEAASLRLVPKARQLDDDPFNELVVESHSILDIDIFFVDENEDNPATKFVDLLVKYDTKELQAFTFLVNRQDVLPVDLRPPFACGGAFECVWFSMEGNDPNPIILKDPLPAGNELEIGTLYFWTKNVDPWPGDGEIDLRFSALHFSNAPAIIGLIDPQVLEVQQVPGPLPLLGVGVFFRYSRKIRKRLSMLN